MVTAIAVVGVARWSQPTNKARWEAIQAQLEVTEKMGTADPMRAWMQKYVATEIRFTARKAVDVGLAKWQWALVLLSPVVSVANWVQALNTIADLRAPLGPDTVGANMCLKQSIVRSGRCTIEALVPGGVSDVYRSATYISCLSILVAVGLYVFFRWNNNRIGGSRLLRVLAGNSDRRQPLLELACNMPALGDGDAPRAAFCSSDEPQAAPETVDCTELRPIEKESKGS